MKSVSPLNKFLFALNIAGFSFLLLVIRSREPLTYLGSVARRTLLSHPIVACPSESENANKVTIASFRNRLLLGAKHLAKAYRYARSSKTILELEAAYSALTKGLEGANSELVAHELFYNVISNISPNVSNKRSAELEVCPETYGGSTYGYPFYEEGFVINCTGLDPKPFQEILTLTLNFANEMSIRDDLAQLTKDILKSRSTVNNYSDLEIVVAVKKNDVSDARKVLKDSGLKFQLVDIESELTLGAIMKKMLESVKTKYVLISKDLKRLDGFSRLERLVRLLSYISADYVGGSHRNQSGHWVAGCYQMAVKNYTMRVVEGYDLSYNSCMYCDYLSSPFAARTSLLQAELDEALTGEQLYADLWLKAHNKLVVMSCPDAMFHSHYSGFVQTQKSDWVSFVKKHELNKLILPTGHEFQYSCEEAGTKCSVGAGRIIPLCCFQELTDALIFAARMFDLHGIGYELEGGSGVGAAKIGGTLPWERDHDFNLRVQNFSAALKLVKEFKKAGYM